jgi:hypothetical protein
VRRRLLLAALGLIASVAVLPVAGAQASSSISSNWAGYAVREPGTRFDRVSGSWTVPAVACVAGQRSYSANWVGLGGYSSSSKALEQLGTESDCSSTGNAVYSAWFEVVPDVARTSSLRMHAGDQVTASTTVSGTRVVLRLANRTTGRSATRTIRADVVDLTSAEWITEAPSICLGTSTSSCTLGRLANFGTTSFTAAQARTTTGRSASISGGGWTPVQISLSQATGAGRPGGRFEQTAVAGAAAAPTLLTGSGDSFSVTYTSSATPADDEPDPGAAFMATRRPAAATR